ncbi:MAG: hypothetical protein WC960_06510 [Bacteroidales bacterium]
MKRYNRLGVLLYILLNSTLLYSQQVINPTLEVRREYDRVLSEIEKSNLKPIIEDSIKSFNLSFQYSTFKKPLKNLYRFTPISASNIKSKEPLSEHLLSLELGSNFPLSPYGSLFISPIGKDKKISLPMGIGYSSYYASLKQLDYSGNTIVKGEEKLFAPRYTTTLFIAPKFSWSKGEAAANLSYRGEGATYHSFGTTGVVPTRHLIRDSLLSRSDIVKLEASVESKLAESSLFHYGAKSSISTLRFRENHPLWLQFKEGLTPYTMVANRIDERSIEVAFWGEVRFKEHNSFKVLAHFNSSGPSSLEQHRTNVELTPTYTFERGEWLLTLGLTFNRSWSNYSSHFNIYPKGLAEREIIKKRVWLYGSIEGKNHFNSLQQMVLRSPWISPNIEIKDIEQPIAMRAGVKGKIIENLSFNLYAGYDQFVNQLHLYGNTALSNSRQVPVNSLGALYKNELSFMLGGSLTYEGERLKLNFSTKTAAYRSQNRDWNEHFNYPKFIFNAFGRYSVKKRLYLTSHIAYRSSVPEIINSSSSLNPIFEIKEAPQYLKIDLQLSYEINRKSTLLLSLENLLNSTIVQYGTYLSPPINGGIGFRYSL